MSMFSDRIDASITRIGQDLSFSTPSATRRGVVRLATSGDLNTYLDDTEMLSIVKPGVVIVFSSSSSVAIGDVFSLDSRSYTVRKVWKQYLSNSVVAVTALAA